MTTMGTWTAQLKGMGRAKGVDGNMTVTGVQMFPSQGIASSKDQGMFMTMTGDMAVLKGFDLLKMGEKSTGVGLYNFMTMSEKLSWINDLIALVTFENSRSYDD